MGDYEDSQVQMVLSKYHLNLALGSIAAIRTALEVNPERAVDFLDGAVKTLATARPIVAASTAPAAALADDMWPHGTTATERSLETLPLYGSLWTHAKYGRGRIIALSRFYATGALCITVGWIGQPPDGHALMAQASTYPIDEFLDAFTPAAPELAMLTPPERCPACGCYAPKHFWECEIATARRAAEKEGADVQL